jgi:hypothetical protein
MTTHISNLTAACIDRSSNDDYVLHRVTFDTNETGTWENKSVEVMATDPMDAIKTIMGNYKG